MKRLLEEYYNVRRQNETLRGNIKLLQSEIERLKNNAETEATKLKHKVVTPQYVVGGGAVPMWSVTGVDASQHMPAGDITTNKDITRGILTDYEYDTGHAIPRDDSHNWG